MSDSFFYTVYRITCQLNNKIYIGKHKTNDLNDNYMGSGNLIRRAIKKYGAENFTKEILYVFNSEVEMNAKEAELVEVGLHTYNLCPGGQGGFGYINERKLGYQLTSDSRMRGSILGNESRRESLKDPLYKAKISSSLSTALKKVWKEKTHPWVGRKHKDTTRKKMRDSHAGKHTGERNSQYGSMWITDGSEEKKIPKTSNIDEGWRRGRKQNAW